MPFDEVLLHLGEHRYPFCLGSDGQDATVARIARVQASRYVVIADERVAALYGETLAAALGDVAPTTLLRHAEGEAHKRLATVERLGHEALQAGADRRAVIVALGGGLTGNVAGLLAALLFRGLRLVHVPTTLLAMMDSVISLKQAVNAAHGKNLLGTFHCPSLVVADTRYLHTLDLRQLRAGTCEVIKNAVAIRPQQIPFLRRELRADARYSDEVLRGFVELGIDAKHDVMREDGEERHAALVCEYGHTVGHAIEHATEGRVCHGDAVGLGMLAEARIARRLGLLDDEGVTVHEELLAAVGLHGVAPADLGVDAVMARVMADNKRGYVAAAHDEVAMVLLERLGRPRVEEGGRPLVRVARAVVAEAIAALRQTPAWRGSP